MPTKYFLFALLIMFYVRVSFAQTKPEVLTNSNVVKLFKAGLGDEIILAKIQSSACRFDISGDALISLKSAGLSGDVIKAMINKTESKNNTASPVANITTEKKVLAAGNSVPEPDIINAVYFYDKSLHSIKPLERNTAALKSQTVALGYGGANLIYQIPGDKSTVRLIPDNTRSFIVNTATGPADIFVLYKVQVKKKTRQAIGAKFTLGGMKGSQGVIAIDLKMIKAGLYEIIPSSKLEKGEYFFTIKSATNATTSNADVYAFGID